MTVVEFYDGVSIHNMVSCLTIKPDKVIFIGERRLIHGEEVVYRRFVDKKNIDVAFDFRSINRNSLEQIMGVLEEIVAMEKDCVFDLTGGDDLVLVAMGIVYERHKDAGNVKMHRFNIRSGILADSDQDGIVPIAEMPRISAEENILLYGGSVIPRAGETGAHQWDFDEEFVEDLMTMWDICRKRPALWNAQLSGFSQVELMPGESGKFPRASVSKNVAKDKSMIRSLESAGLIRDVKETEKNISFGFKNAKVRECLAKAGNVLELIVTYYAKMARDNKGQTIYNDVVTGVYIDWDAEIHEMSAEVKDTVNEIDVLLMKGLVPVFVSCKNGAVDQSELYKLHAVAERFGGPYAKKVLICTYFGKDKGVSHQYFLQRAKDMNIRVIENVHELTGEQFVSKISNLWN